MVGTLPSVRVVLFWSLLGGGQVGVITGTLLGPGAGCCPPEASDKEDFTMCKCI